MNLWPPRHLKIWYLFVWAFVALISAEAALRVYELLAWDISILEGLPMEVGGLSPITADAVLGWRATENYRFDGKVRNADGTEYAVRFSQDKNGFRMFGNPYSRKPKIFVIGDSDTHATAVSDDKTYYAILKGALDVEIFAYGARSYGSLQEWMILDKYYDLIKPDLVLWQYSIDDLIDNLPGPRSADDGPAVGYCRICDAVANRVKKLLRVGNRSAAVNESTDELAQSEFLKSVEVTDKIMRMVAERARPAPVFAFVTGTADSSAGPEYKEALAQISQRNHIVFFGEIENGVLAAQDQGADTTIADHHHWNELAHRIVGHALANALRQARKPSNGN